MARQATLRRALTAGLQVQLDAPLPAELGIGAGTAVFVCGRCSVPGARIASLELVVDGVNQPLLAAGMPRIDALQDGATSASYGSGFWGFARIAGPEPQHALGLRALLAGGGGRPPCSRASRSRRRSRRSPMPRPRWRSAWRRTSRRPELFARQVESIRAQTHRGLGLRGLRRLLDPERFATMRGRARRRPALRALALARAGSASTRTSSARWRWRRPARAYVALADQDDVWHPDKLAALLAEVGDARARLQRRADRRRGRRGSSPTTYWSHRAQQPLRPGLAARRQLGHRRGVAVPARPARRRAARSRRPSSRTSTTTGSRSARSRSATSRYVDRPLYDYVQHGQARRSVTPRRTGCRACSIASGPCGGARASARGCGACTTSSTPAGCSSSRPSCSCAAGTG